MMIEARQCRCKRSHHPRLAQVAHKLRSVTRAPTPNQASSFNRPIGNWNIGAVTEMRYMFHYASAFDQDLGWCVDDDVSLTDAFAFVPCASTSCGVTQGSCTRRNF